ncbi:MAG: YMGG-like glycine zipper-containing protein, partial [Pseudomonadota bacterium]
MKTTLTVLAAAALLAGCQNVSNRTLSTTAGGAIIGAGVGMMAGGDDKRNAAIGAVVGALAGAGVGVY